MLSPTLCVGVFWVIAALIAPSCAQTNRLFQWGFANTALSSSLPTCYPLSIIVKSFNTTTNDTIGTPPYYMTSYVVGGTPVTYFIGTDQDNLTWKVTEPVGSKLVLGVVDANGSSGGISPNIFTVTEGIDTQCVNTPSTTPPFTLTANITGDLQTCQPWGFVVNGGVPPYVITFAQPNSLVVTNASMPSGDDGFVFINRAEPNGQLIAAVSDDTGRWASGTPIVNTKGSSNTSCVGLVTSSVKAVEIQHIHSTPNKIHAVAVGLSVTLLLLLLLGLGVCGLIYRRRRKRDNEALFNATIPRQFVEVEAQMSFIPIRTLDEDVTAPPPQYQRDSPLSNHLPSRLPDVRVAHERLIGQTFTEQTPRYLSSPAMHQPSAGFTNFPSSSVRRSAKLVEASIHSAISPDSEYVLETAISDSSNVLGNQLSAMSSVGASAVRSFRTGEWIEEQPEISYQHHDIGVGGDLPPPYVDTGPSELRPIR